MGFQPKIKGVDGQTNISNSICVTTRMVYCKVISRYKNSAYSTESDFIVRIIRDHHEIRDYHTRSLEQFESIPTTIVVGSIDIAVERTSKGKGEKTRSMVYYMWG